MNENKERSEDRRLMSSLFTLTARTHKLSLFIQFLSFLQSCVFLVHWKPGIKPRIPKARHMYTTGEGTALCWLIRETGAAAVRSEPVSPQQPTNERVPSFRGP